jgi:hypothetical protein
LHQYEIPILRACFLLFLFLLRLSHPDSRRRRLNRKRITEINLNAMPKASRFLFIFPEVLFYVITWYSRRDGGQ